MALKYFVLIIAILAVVTSISHASDPSPLQDFCVAVNDSMNAVAFAGLCSQNPGVITIENAVFGSNPSISDDVLAKAFQIDKKVVDYLQSQFWWDNN
ncbi:hypothetical protein R3W88_003228 [Solanum pinnatisectum]|uniref:Cupin type-1 domain-containing protein n=1 Tax=Solanum pinnatisectum TaxID=50273 RepID=A0AAV9MP45_9SOLN|nr:hypothetical protein R3W88_003228 [Solanum pinnatisectum]